MSEVPCSLLPDGILQFTAILGGVTGGAKITDVRVDDSYTSDDELVEGNWFQTSWIVVAGIVTCTFSLPASFVGSATTILVRAYKVEKSLTRETRRYNPFTINVPLEVADVI